MEIDAATMGLLAVAGAVAAPLALFIAGLALVRQRRMRALLQALSQLSGGSGSADKQEDLLTLLRRQLEQLGQVRTHLAQQARNADELRSLISGCVSRVGTVRYDAFGDMGGRLSFSVALLNERGDGTILTAINGRTETHAYAKPVVAGKSDHNLSNEETAAIAQALGVTGRRLPRDQRVSAALS